MRDMVSPTAQVYGALERAYFFFNSELFAGSLPTILLTLQHKGKRTRGFFSANRFTGRKTRRSADELAMNPIHFAEPLEEILATLVHQMVHIWQQYQDVPSRAGYHNDRWAKKMIEIGLQPSQTGKPGGKATGQRMSQHVIRGGAFQIACHRLLKSGFDVVWAEAMENKTLMTVKVDVDAKGRVAFQCPDCMLKAWAKPSAMIICGACRVSLVRR